MKTALLELRRRPGRFTTATVVLTLLVVLLLFLGALLDGLFLGSTGALRAQQADVVVYSAEARTSLLRSRIGPDVRDAVAGADGVEEVGGLGVALLGATVPGEDEVADVAVFGYEVPPAGVPEPPADGQGWADRSLESQGVEVGQVLEVGPAAVPVEIVGWVSDTDYLLQGAVWTTPATWREVQNANRPDAAVGDDVFQALVASGSGSSADLAAAVDAATGGATEALTKDEAVLSLPGTREQNSTFTLIIGTTFAIAGVVVALFFALLTLERVPVYGLLKAIGTPTRSLLAGLLVQAVVVSAVAFAIGWLLVTALAAGIPPGVPVRFEPSRAVTTLVGILATALVGGALSLRRVVKVDPAAAIGTGT